MNNFRLVVLLLLLSSNSYASDCFLYEQLYKKGLELLRFGDLIRARQHFQSIQIKLIKSDCAAINQSLLAVMIKDIDASLMRVTKRVSTLQKEVNMLSANSLKWEKKYSNAIKYSQIQDLSPGDALLVSNHLLRNEGVGDLRVQLGWTMAKILNESNRHRFRKIEEFKNIIDARASPGGRWMAMKVQGGRSGVSMFRLLYDSQLERELTYPDDNKDVATLTFSGDDTWLLTRFVDNTLELRNLETSQVFEVNRLGIPKSVLFSADSKFFTIDYGDQIQVIDAETGIALEFFAGKKIDYAGFSKTGASLLFKCQSDSLEVYDLVKRSRRSLPNSSKPISHAFSPNGEWVSIHFSDGTRVFNINTRQEVLDLKPREARATFFSPNSQFIVCVHSDNMRSVRELPSGGKAPEFLVDRVFEDITFSPNGEYICSSVRGDSLKIRKLVGSQLSLVLTTESAIDNIFFSHSGRKALLAYANGKAKVWDIEIGVLQELQISSRKIVGVDFSQSDDQLVVHDIDHFSRCYQLTRQVWMFMHDQFDFKTCFFLRSGRLVATQNEDNEIEVWRTGDKKPDYFYKADGKIDSISFSTDRNWLFVHRHGGGIEIINGSTGEESPALVDGQKYSVSLVPGHDWLVRSYDSDTRALEVVEIASGKRPDVLNGSENMKWVSFSHGGTWMIYKTLNGRVVVKNWHTNKTYDFLNKEMDIFSAKFSSHNTWLITKHLSAVEGINVVTKVWNIDSLSQPYFSKTDKLIDDAIISGDENFLAIRYADGLIKIFDSRKGKLVENEKINNQLHNASFSYDSEWLSTHDAVSNSRLWNLKTMSYTPLLESEGKLFPAVFSWDSQCMVVWRSEFKKSTLKLSKSPFISFFSSREDADGIEKIEFSRDNRWVIIRNVRGKYKILEVPSLVEPKFLSNKSINAVSFSESNDRLAIATGHKIEQFDLQTGKLRYTLFTNKPVMDVNILNSGDLYGVTGKAVVRVLGSDETKVDFTYGDGDRLDYSPVETMEWIENFQNKLLSPLSRDLRQHFEVGN